VVYFGIIAFAFLGGLAQTVSGFGSGVILMMFLPYFFSMTEAPALNSSISMAITFILSWQYRKSIEWKKIALPALLYIGMALVGILLVGSINVRAVKIFLGLFLIALAVFFFLFSKKIHLKGNLTECAFCCTFSGFTSGLFGIGGPLMALYFVSITDDYKHYTADLQIIFALNSISALAMRVAKGYYTVRLIPLTLIGFVGIFIGKWLGTKIATRIDSDLFKKIVYALVAVSGMITVLEELG